MVQKNKANETSTASSSRTKNVSAPAEIIETKEGSTVKQIKVKPTDNKQFASTNYPNKKIEVCNKDVEISKIAISPFDGRYAVLLTKTNLELWDLLHITN